MDLGFLSNSFCDVDIVRHPLQNGGDRSDEK